VIKSDELKVRDLLCHHVYTVCSTNDYELSRFRYKTCI